MSSSTARLTHDAYTVGWISALPLEMAAAMAILDASHASLPQPNADHNTYHLGEIGQHNIVLACLPNGIYGLASAAVIAKQMMMTFPSVEFGLMVGIGGGAPSESADIRLGDVVVSKPTNGHPGVVQYDYGKTLANGVFHRTGTLNNPPEVLLTAISDVQAKHKLGINHINTHLESAATRNPSLSQSCKYPGASLDILFESSYDHPTGAVSCMGCESSRRILRPPRTSTEPHVHYGLIASANQVMKDSRARDNLRQELGILCYEMEAAGLANHFPCLVIRGISDYSDSHKNKGWQDYAAATAAAYARGLLEFSVRTIVRKPESGSARIRSRIPISKSTFCGRKLELEQIRQCLDGSTQVRQGAVIWGFSGFGKSQLALQYITSRGAEYGSLLWIDCSSQATIDQSLEDIMSELQPSTRIGRSAVDIVLAWLEQDTNNSWIMVLDGVENMNDADSVNDIDIRMLFPSCSHGHILLITTSPDLHVRLGFPGISIQNVDDRTGAEILMVSAGASIDDASMYPCLPLRICAN
ncbi:nucleoside phosphorylase domain-containing protein [Aspergillus californicus]